MTPEFEQIFEHLERIERSVREIGPSRRVRGDGQLSRDVCVLILDVVFTAAGATCSKRDRARAIAAITGFSAAGIANLFAEFDRHIEALEFEADDSGEAADRFFRKVSSPAAVWLRRLGIGNDLPEL